MKKILSISAAALIVATGAASAMTAHGAVEGQVRKFVPNADLSGLSNGEVAHINSIINDDGDDSFVQTQARLKAILKKAG